MSAGRRGGFLGEGGVHFSQMGPNADVREGPEKEQNSAPGFAAYRAAEYTASFLDNPYPHTAACCLSPQSRARTLVFHCPSLPSSISPVPELLDSPSPSKTPAVTQTSTREALSYQPQLSLVQAAHSLAEHPHPTPLSLKVHAVLPALQPGQVSAAPRSQASAPSSPTAGADHAGAIY